MEPVVNLTGLVAGALVTASALPKLIERVRRLASGDAHFSPTDLYRDGLQGIGNGLWVCVGLAAGIYPVALFCGLSSLFLGTLVVLNLRSRGRG